MFYCYEHSGKVVTKAFPLGKAPMSILVGKVRYKRSFQAERVGVPPTAGWPIECVASGVHPDQRQELSDFLAKRGVPTEVSKDGNPIYTSPQHRRKALKARGIHDRNSYL